MSERQEYAPRRLPMTMLDGDKVEHELRQTKRLILPKGSKALLIACLPHHLEDFDERNLGPTTFTKDFIGAIDGNVKDEFFLGLRPGETRITLVPDSDERREYASKKYKLDQQITPLYRLKHEEGYSLTWPNEQILEKGLDQTHKYVEQIALIDQQLAAEFLAERQNEVEIFSNLDQNAIRRVRLQVAVDRHIQIPGSLTSKTTRD